MKRFIIIASLLVGFQMAFAADFSAVSPSGHTLYYNILDATAHTLVVTYPAPYWTGYTRPTGALVIPDTVSYMGTNYIVTVIGGFAFEGCSGVTAVTLPNTLNVVEGNAFYDCHISNLTIPDNVKRIYSGAFTRGTGGSINNLYVPDGIEYIEYGAFPTSGNWISSKPAGIVYLGKIAYCYKGAFPQNTTLVFASDTRGISSVRNIVNPVYYYPERIDSIVFPDSLRYIGYDCFAGCTNLRSINLPYSLQIIEGSSFNGCGSLSQVTIPPNVKIIGLSAFSQCGNLTTVNYNAINCTTADMSFYGCENLTTVNIGNSVHVIPSGLFRRCTHLSNVNMSESVIKIGKEAFSYTAITSFTIPKNVDSIGRDVFYGCSSLQTIYYNAINCYISASVPFEGARNVSSIIWGNEVQTIPHRLCSYLANLRGNLSFPNSLRNIGNSAFYECTGLSGTLTLPNNLQYIGEGAFGRCTRLSGALTLPNNLQYLGSSAFYECIGLNGNLVLPNTLQHIGSNAFSNCAGLSGSLIIPNNTHYIGDYAFSNCNNITNLTIGENIDTMNRAFSNMQGLVSVQYNSRNCQAGEGAFSNDSSISTFSIGTNVINIPDDLVSELGNLSYVNFPEGLTRIGMNNFSFLNITSDIVLPSTLQEIGYGAFAFCGNPNQIICKPEIPPTVTVYGGVAIFAGHYNVPLRVPCESIESYRNAQGWNVFTNISGISNCDTNTNSILDVVVDENVCIHSINGHIVIDGIVDDILVFDIMGRKVDGGRKIRFDVPTSGVYLVKIGTVSTQKIVVMK